MNSDRPVTLNLERTCVLSYRMGMTDVPESAASASNALADPPDPTCARRILLVQLADLGDMVLTTPAIAALRQARPDAHLTLLAGGHVLDVVDPALLNATIVWQRRGVGNRGSMLMRSNWQRLRQLDGAPYDAIVFFHHFTLRLGTVKFRLLARASGAPIVLGLQNDNAPFLTHSVADEGFGARHQAQYWLDLVALLGADASPRPARVALHRGLLPLDATNQTRIIVHPGGGSSNLARRWEPEKFAQVADELHHRFDAQIVLVGGADDDVDAVRALMQSPAVDLSGRTTLTALCDVLRSADLFIGAESGVMHLAAAVQTPSVVLFGPGNEAAWGPWMPSGEFRIVRTVPLCAPCAYVGHGIGLRHGCEARTCMKMIDTTRVLEAATRLLEPSASAGNGEVLPDRSTPAVRQHARRRRHDERVTMLDIPVDRITYQGWMATVERWVQADDRAHQVCTVNPEFVMMAQRDPNFRHILQRADLCIADGVGLLWAARRLAQPLPERVTGSDGVFVIAETAARLGWRLYLLGAAEGVAEQAAQVLVDQYAQLQIAGTYSGSPSGEEEADIVARINAAQADVLLVAYGATAQDKWIARNLPRLHVSMAMGVGGAFDFVAGIVPRAPAVMQRYGLEWLYRLYRQPWRWRRMLRLPRFVVSILRQRPPRPSHEKQ